MNVLQLVVAGVGIDLVAIAAILRRRGVDWPTIGVTLGVTAATAAIMFWALFALIPKTGLGVLTAGGW